MPLKVITTIDYWLKYLSGNLSYSEGKEELTVTW